MKSFGIFAVLVLASAVAFAQTTDPATAFETTTVTLVIPGLVGIDVGSDDVEFDFGAYGAAPAAGGCVTNKWPVAITCTSGTVQFHPTTVTTTGPGNAPVNTATEKAIWLAAFCSKATGTLDIEAEIGTFSDDIGFVGVTPLDATIMATRRSSTENGGAGHPIASPYEQFAVEGVPESIPHSLAATFPWTRIDQSIALVLPYNAALAETAVAGIEATLTYTISK